jgi:hypothetical protein
MRDTDFESAEGGRTGLLRETGGIHGTRTKSGATQSVGPAVLPGSAHVQGTGTVADVCSAVSPEARESARPAKEPFRSQFNLTATRR